MLTLGTVVLGVGDMNRAVEFWTQALGYVPRASNATPEWTSLDPPDGGRGTIALELSESPVQEHPRVHVDLFPTGDLSVAEEVGRLVGLGAQVVDWDLYPEDPDFTVLADTEGNRFCVIDLEHDRKPT